MTQSPGIFAPTGRIDSSNAGAAERELAALMAQSGPSVVLDLTLVDYLSSAGLRVLLIAAKTASSKGGKAVIAGAKPMVAEVLRMSGFDKLMPVAADRDAALALLA